MGMVSMVLALGAAPREILDHFFFGKSSFHTYLHMLRKWRHQILTYDIIHISRLLLVIGSVRPSPQTGVPILRLPAHVAQEALVADQKALLGD